MIAAATVAVCILWAFALGFWGGRRLHELDAANDREVGIESLIVTDAIDAVLLRTGRIEISRRAPGGDWLAVDGDRRSDTSSDWRSCVRVLERVGRGSIDAE